MYVRHAVQSALRGIEGGVLDERQEFVDHDGVRLLRKSKRSHKSVGFGGERDVIACSFVMDKESRLGARLRDIYVRRVHRTSNRSGIREISRNFLNIR